MANRKAGPKISCEIRCIDPATVEIVSRHLDTAGIEWVTYTCKLSGAEESVLLIGDKLAAEIMRSLPRVDSITATKILAALYYAELCECDVATLTRVAEHKAVTQLLKFKALGMVGHRRIQGMNYYRLTSDHVRRSINTAVEAVS